MIQRFLRLKRPDITPIQFILEGYEGLVTVTTENPLTASLRIAVMPEFSNDLDGVLLDLKKIFAFQEIDNEPSLRLKEET